MTTTQKYVGKANYALTTALAAKKQAKTLPSADQRSETDTPPKAWKPSPLMLLHIDIWYDGKKSEMNLMGPNMIWGDFIELQYYYLRQYFRKVGEWMKLEAYQASLCFPQEDGSIRTLTTYEKVYFSPEEAFKSGQYFEASDNRKGGQNNE